MLTLIFITAWSRQTLISTFWCFPIAPDTLLEVQRVPEKGVGEVCGPLERLVSAGPRCEPLERIHTSGRQSLRWFCLPGTLGYVWRHFWLLCTIDWSLLASTG